MCLGWVSVVKRNKVQARAIKEKKNRQEQQDSALKSTASLLHGRGPGLALHVGVATAVIGVRDVRDGDGCFFATGWQAGLLKQ